VGEKTGPNPTDRAKSGTKRSVLVEAAGLPVGLAVAGANVNDFKLARETLESIPVKKPRPSPRRRQGLCLDKGYDYDEVRRLAHEYRLTPHIRSRGEEAVLIKRGGRFKARRWVVERTHSWTNRFRRALVRWEKKAENYVAMVHLCFACIAFHRSGLLLG
jgi:putative transposase